MNTTNYIRIFRGDDSDALGYQTIVGTIKTDIDLAGCKAVFRFLGFYAEFDPIPEDKKLTIVIPAQASRGFPPGVGYASLKVIDAYGKIRTFTNRIPVIVDTMTPSSGYGEFEVSFSPFPELEPLKIFTGPNADDFDQYTGFVSKIINRASLVKYGLVMLADAMSEDSGASGKAASPLAVKAAYNAIIKELVDNYYTAEQTDEAIERVAAYYITYNAAGEAFPTRADLLNATTYYSGGAVRVPTRNDYAVILADETHGGAEWRYIYTIPDSSTTGQWEAQYPIETNDYSQLSNKPQINGVTLLGNKTAAQLGLATPADLNAKSFIRSPDGRTTVSAVDGGSATISKLGYGNASVHFPEGFSIQYASDPAYVAPSGGETIEFFGPISSTAEPSYRFWVPYAYKDSTDFDPANQSVWCFFGDDASNPVPEYLMFCTGAGYSISNWDSATQTLTLSYGEVTGDPPTMTRVETTATKGVATLEEIAALAPDWTRGSNYTRYDVVKRYGVYFYAKADINNSTIAPSSDTIHWGPLANLAALAHLFLPLTGGTVDGSITFTSNNGPLLDNIVIRKIDDGVVEFYNGYDGFYVKLAARARAYAASVGDIADDFSTSATYAVNALCVYGGVLYRCTTAITTAEAWTPAHWTTATVEDVLAALRTSKADVSAIPYDRITITTGQLQDHAKQKVALNAATTTLTLPALTDLTGKVSDFGIDMVNGYEVSGTPTAASFSLDGTIGTDYNLIVPEGEDWSEMSTLAAGEMVVYYFTLSAFQINDKPTWEVMKKVVTLVPVPSAP